MEEGNFEYNLTYEGFDRCPAPSPPDEERRPRTPTRRAPRSLHELQIGPREEGLI